MRRVRILFVNCPSLSTDAASFLLLAQNKVQTSIEFEVAHHWVYGATLPDANPIFRRITKLWLEDRLPKIDWLERRIIRRLDLRAAPFLRKPLTRHRWYNAARSVVDNYDSWFASSGYNKFDTQPQPTIVVTETPIGGGYIGSARDDIAVVTLAGWNRFFKPGSALEYILVSVQRYSLRLLYKNIGSHYVTRGCIWDFDVYQPDTRIAAYTGSLCSTFRRNLTEVISNEEMVDISKLITNEWIGSNDVTTSASAILKKVFHYPLRRSTGLHPGIMESISHGMRTEIGKFFFDILKIVLAAVGTLYIASRFPEAYEILDGR